MIPRERRGIDDSNRAVRKEGAKRKETTKKREERF